MDKHYTPKDIRQETVAGIGRAWGVTVVFGRRDHFAPTARRYYYATRAAAEVGDIGDDIGVRGRVA